MLGRGHISVEPHQVGKSHPGFAKNRRNGAKAKMRLRLDAFGDRAVAADAELPGAQDYAGARRDFDAVRVVGEWRVDRTRIQSAHIDGPPRDFSFGYPLPRGKAS